MQYVHKFKITYKSKNTTTQRFIRLPFTFPGSPTQRQRQYKHPKEQKAAHQRGFFGGNTHQIIYSSANRSITQPPQTGTHGLSCDRPTKTPRRGVAFSDPTKPE
jgi:hypothetical protein